MVVHELLRFCKCMDYAEWTDVQYHNFKWMAKYGYRISTIRIDQMVICLLNYTLLF
jgi:hypothetical protein